MTSMHFTKVAAFVFAFAGVGALHASCDRGGCGETHDVSYTTFEDSGCPGDCRYVRRDFFWDNIIARAPELVAPPVNTTLPDFDLTMADRGITVTDWSGISRSTAMDGPDFSAGTGPREYQDYSVSYERARRGAVQQQEIAVTAEPTGSEQAPMRTTVPTVGLGMAPRSAAGYGTEFRPTDQTPEVPQSRAAEIETPGSTSQASGGVFQPLSPRARQSVPAGANTIDGKTGVSPMDTGGGTAGAAGPGGK